MNFFICLKCNNDFSTRKSLQKFCSKSCANSFNTAKRKVDDKSIFEGAMTQVKAYILGMFLADGCLSYDNYNNRLY